MDEIIIVSSDSHAGVPKELWPEYLDKRFHELIPRLHEDNEIYPTAIFLLGAKRGATTTLPELRTAHQEGWHGLHDPVLRLADMDREGVAAELIYHGDFRLGDLFHNNTNRKYPLEAWDAGARAWNRWAADNFGFAMDRFLVTGAIGPCIDMDTAVADIRWIADRGFAATYVPGYMRHANTAPLFDDSWEPFWSACEECGIALVVHAGFGWDQGTVFPQLEKIRDDVSKAAGSLDRDVLFAHADAVADESVQFFSDFLNSPRPRRPMWQLMLGGVFDRHPDLELVLTEIRADWIPATLRHLDACYEADRGDLPAQRRPSEYWRSNCLAGASFIHKAEVEMRHEIGVETISFGRDFPHPEGTWPHTKEWLRDAFAGVPEHDVRLLLGENLIRFLDLDRDRLAELARRIGPTLDDIVGDTSGVAPELIENFDARGGYLKPAEGSSRIDVVGQLVQDDVLALSGRPR
ncbi:MAG TPA: amidohydrolase family protein [Acidimicrobiia bacterium]|nr:amidohydrolase family protein [Acidimicrobiia bacterium]